MEKELNQELVYKASKDVLVEIKADANELLKSYNDADLFVTNKSMSLLQILFPSFVAIFGFIIVELSNNRMSQLLVFSSIECFVIFLSCYYLFEVLALNKVPTVGTKPSKILQDDIFLSSEQESLLQYLRIKVYGLNCNITVYENAYASRTVNFKKALNILMIGTSLVVFIFVVFQGYQVLFPNK